MEYNFVNGIYKVEGYDRDHETQNGAGKSTFSSAISQCLYNKSPKNPKSLLEGTYNTVTGNPYCIELELEVNGDLYVITNDRSRNNIFITQNTRALHIKGIKNQLEFIKDLIGVDYDTFNALTYLSQSSVSSVFDLTDTNNVLYKFFDVDTIKQLSIGLKNTRRDLGKRKSFLERTITEQNRLIGMLERYEEVDITPYQEAVDEIEKSIQELKNAQIDGKAVVLRHKKDKLSEELSQDKVKHAELKTEYTVLKAQLSQLETGVCPVCESVVTDKTDRLQQTIQNIREPLKELTDNIKTKQEELDKVTDTLNSIENVYQSNLKALQNDLQVNKNKIILVQEKNRNHQEMRGELGSLKEKLKGFEQDLETVNNGLIFVNSALEVINKGLLTKSYIANFITVFNKKILELLSLLDMSFEVYVNEVSGSLQYNITKQGKSLPFNSLSSGERTRVSLVVLLAILESLELMTNIKFNVVIFDELLSVLDASGVEVFKTVLNQYRENKNVFVILHHDEITSDYFDGYVYLIKEKGLTTMQVKAS